IACKSLPKKCLSRPHDPLVSLNSQAESSANSARTVQSGRAPTGNILSLGLQSLRQDALVRGRSGTYAMSQTVRAVCPHDCPDTCGMLVAVEDGKAVGLRGDPEHPFTRGFLCQKVARYLDRVYHPDRLRWPLKRIGPKGKSQFARITWDEAVATVARR